MNETNIPIYEVMLSINDLKGLGHTKGAGEYGTDIVCNITTCNIEKNND